MRALREDGEDLGMIHFKDLGRKDVLDVDACVECGRCTDVCPANLSGGTLSPKEIILDLRQGLLSGGDVVAGTAEEKRQGKAFITEDDLFQCFSCGACEYVCPVGIEHVGRKILDLRRGLASEGRISNDRVNQLFTTMERAPHNPWGIAHDTRQKLIESKQFPIFDGTQEWLFWLGCGLSFDPHGQAVAQAMRQILDAAGVSWGVLARETCCGEPARRAGNEYLFMELSGKLVESFESAGVKRIVTCCPHCTTMLDKDYRQIAAYAELGIEVMHHTEFIEKVLPKLSLKASGVTAAYHDPCYLARGRGITAAPRKSCTLPAWRLPKPRIMARIRNAAEQVARSFLWPTTRASRANSASTSGASPNSCDPGHHGGRGVPVLPHHAARRRQRRQARRRGDSGRRGNRGPQPCAEAGGKAPGVRDSGFGGRCWRLEARGQVLAGSADLFSGSTVGSPMTTICPTPAADLPYHLIKPSGMLGAAYAFTEIVCGEYMMRTTLKIDDDMLHVVQEETGARTKTQAVQEVLKDYVRRRKIEKLIQLQGKVPFSSDAKTLRKGWERNQRGSR